jgi:hypothetical protein
MQPRPMSTVLLPAMAVSCLLSEGYSGRWGMVALLIAGIAHQIYLDVRFTRAREKENARQAEA